MEKKYDYSIFTKQELICFLTNYDSYCWHIHKPFDIMIVAKMDNLQNLILKNLEKYEDISNIYEINKDAVTYFVDWEENNNERRRLNKEYEKLRKLRFGE